MKTRKHVNMQTDAATRERYRRVMLIPLEERKLMMQRLAAKRSGLASYRANIARGIDPAARAREGKRRKAERRAVEAKLLRAPGPERRSKWLNLD